MRDEHGQARSAARSPRRWRKLARGLDWTSVLFIGYMAIGELIRSQLPDRAHSDASWHGCRITTGWFSISAHCPETVWGRIVEFWVESSFVMKLFPHALLSGTMLSGHQPWIQVAPSVAFAVLQIFLLLWLIVLLIRLPIRGLRWTIRKTRA